MAEKPAAYLALIVSSAMFASGYILARAIDPEAGLGMFVAQALFFCALTLTFFRPGAGNGRITRKAVAAIVFNGACSPCIIFLVLGGSRMVTPALAAIIVISNVLMIAALAWVLGRKKFTPIQLVALGSGFTGIVWISLGKGAFGGEGLGVLYLLTAAALIAAITVAIERPVTSIGWAPVTRWSFWVGSVVAILAVWAHGSLRFHSLEQTALAMVMGAVGLGAPVLMFNMGMSRLGSADAAAFKLLIPFFALIYGFVILKETPGLSSSIAGFLVVGSVALYQFSGAKEELGIAGAPVDTGVPGPAAPE